MGGGEHVSSSFSIGLALVFGFSCCFLLRNKEFFQKVVAGLCFISSLILSAVVNPAFNLEAQAQAHDQKKQKHPLNEKQNQVVRFPDLQILGEEDEELARKVFEGSIKSYTLEKYLGGDCLRAVMIRRRALEMCTGKSVSSLPIQGLDYDSVQGKNCEMPIGYVQVPVTLLDYLLLDGEKYYVPMATTEGCLIASCNRGCKAIRLSGGATSLVLRDGMTRSPLVTFNSVVRATELKFYLESPENFNEIAAIFNSSSRFARLESIKSFVAGRHVYIRFRCTTGDAMGMNMISIASEKVLTYLINETSFSDMKIVAVSGNMCSDKKAANVNWIEGRGKSVVCEAVIKGQVLREVLKVDVSTLVELNIQKNLVGSAVAGATGGFNAHAANIVAAVFIATGQDPAQVVESSHCLTQMEPDNDGNDLHVSVTLPCLEVGGGTHIQGQATCLDLLGVKGSNDETPGSNAKQLARIIAGAVLAGELSLLACLANGDLVSSHMTYNR